MHALVSPLVDGFEGIIRTYLAHRNKQAAPNLANILPNDDYCILVAAYNEATRPSNTRGVSRLEKHLEILKAWRDKIILVDDGSTDSTAEIARVANYTVFRCEENGYKVGSVLKALHTLNTEYVVITDLDSYPDPDASSLEIISRLVGWVHREGLGGSCATLLPHVRSRPTLNFSAVSVFFNSLTSYGSYCLELIQLAEYVLAMRLTRASQNTASNRHIMTISGGFGVYRRSAYIQACSQFVIHPDRFFSMEDVFNTSVIAGMGLRTGYAPPVVVRTEVPFTPFGLIRQRSEWERATIRNLLIHLKLLLRKPGYRVEAAWTAFHTILLRPVKYLTIGPLIGYGLVHPDVLLGWYIAYLIILTLLLRLHATTAEFRQIRGIILLLPIYSFLMNTFVYTKGWAEEMAFQVARSARKVRNLPGWRRRGYQLRSGVPPGQA